MYGARLGRAARARPCACLPCPPTGGRARIARLETHGIVELRVVPERMADLTRAAGAARPCRGGDAASLTPRPPPPPSLRLRKQGGRVPLSGPRSALKVLHDGVRLRDMVPACRRLWPLEDVIDQVFPFGSPSYPYHPPSFPCRNEHAALAS